MAKNEKTSKEVAVIAGRILSGLRGSKKLGDIIEICVRKEWRPLCTIGELKALAASCLTQTADRKRRP